MGKRKGCEGRRGREIVGEKCVNTTRGEEVKKIDGSKAEVKPTPIRKYGNEDCNEKNGRAFSTKSQQGERNLKPWGRKKDIEK